MDALAGLALRHAKRARMRVVLLSVASSLGSSAQTTPRGAQARYRQGGFQGLAGDPAKAPRHFCDISAREQQAGRARWLASGGQAVCGVQVAEAQYCSAAVLATLCQPCLPPASAARRPSTSPSPSTNTSHVLQDGCSLLPGQQGSACFLTAPHGIQITSGHFLGVLHAG